MSRSFLYEICTCRYPVNSLRMPRMPLEFVFLLAVSYRLLHFCIAHTHCKLPIQFIQSSGAFACMCSYSFVFFTSLCFWRGTLSRRTVGAPGHTRHLGSAPMPACLSPGPMPSLQLETAFRFFLLLCRHQPNTCPPSIKILNPIRPVSRSENAV